MTDGNAVLMRDPAVGPACVVVHGSPGGTRLDAARGRVKQLLDRTRFLRQHGEKGAAR
jgi:hypothetical protein